MKKKMVELRIRGKRNWLFENEEHMIKNGRIKNSRRERLINIQLNFEKLRVKILEGNLLICLKFKRIVRPFSN